MVMTIDKDKKLATFKGKVKWATIPPNNPRGPYKDSITDANKDDLMYSIEVECSPEEFKQLQEYKIPKLQGIKKDEETGLTYLRVKASKVKTNTNPAKNNGENFIFKDIPVVYTDGEAVTDPAANGSEAVVRVFIEETKRGHVLRLKGVMFTNLIKFDSEDVFDDLVAESDNNAAADNTDVAQDEFGF